MESQTLSARGYWAAESQPFRIEYSATVLEEIRAAAVTGMCKFPRGGLEVGGILFGTVEDDVIRIERAHPAPCSYAHGPSYLIEGPDEDEFAKALAAAPELTPVGWYHSHTRSGLELTPQDAALHERFFPEPWQVALLLRPEPFGTADASFFARREDGSLETSPVSVFLVRPGARRRRHGRPEYEPAAVPAVAVPAAIAAMPEIAEMPEMPLAAAPEPALVSPPPAPAPRRDRRGAGWKPWLAFAAAVVLGIAVWIGAALWNPPAASRLSLEVTDIDGQLDIRWDRNAAAVREARSAALEIQDGGERIRMPLSPERLRAGSVTYARGSEAVEVRLEVDGRKPASDSVRLVARPVSPPPPAAETAPAPETAPVVPPAAAAAAAAAVAAAEPSPEVRRAPVESRIRTDNAGSVPARPAPRPFNIASLQRTDARRPLPAPPQVQSDVQLPRSQPPAAVTAPQAAPPQAAPKQPPPEPSPPPAAIQTPAAKPAYAGPTSGRVIWVGKLERGARLSIDGARASFGALTGELPGVPVIISAQPAELGSGGLRVYASNPADARSREAAGPQNGWNATTYDWNPRRLTDVLVTEVPSPQNGWKGVSLRGNGSPVSVIVIDWRVASN